MSPQYHLLIPVKVLSMLTDSFATALNISVIFISSSEPAYSDISIVGMSLDPITELNSL